MRKHIIFFILLGISLAFLIIVEIDSKTSHWVKVLYSLITTFLGILLGIAAEVLRNSWEDLSIMASIALKGKLNTEIRVSISYLFRISIKDEHGKNQYLLVKNRKMNPKSFQPVGGVYKYYDRSFLNKIDAKDADEFHEKNDFRLKILGKRLPALLRHFRKKTDREVDHSREFYEELISTRILSKENFPFIEPRFIELKNSGFRYSEHFRKWEINFHEIYELLLSDKQENELRSLLKKNSASDNFIFVDENLITQKGHDNTANQDLYKINEHTIHII